jgi:hypothetical protein
MSDDLDPGLRRLFAETTEHPADEAFVAAVTERTAREPRIGLALRRLAAGFLPGLTVAVVAAGLGLALRQGSQVIMPLMDASPLGTAAGLGLAVAILVCLRLLAPLAQRHF